MPSSRRIAQSALPVDRYFPSDSLVVGAGVVIFHLATDRVVLCRHGRDGVWFLPKGRRDASEDTGTTACREGFEESGYRNRLLPLPIDHVQPRPFASSQPWDTEPIATRMMPVSGTYQYLLFWYAAETIPEDVENALNVAEAPFDPSAAETSRGAVAETAEHTVIKKFAMPPVFPGDLTLRQRVQMDERVGEGGQREIYEPVRHEGTGVDEEEALYESFLLPVADAMKLLGGSSRDVVGRAWEAVQLRRQMEAD